MKVLIVTFPRQASKFFAQALIESSSLSYAQGYFDPLQCAEAHKEQVSRHWGGNVYKASDESLLTMLDATIMQDSVDLIMDRYSSLKIPFLRQRFRLIIVYRERSYTFPTSKPEDMLMLYDKFVRAMFRPNLEQSTEHNVLMGHLDKLQSLMHHLPVTEDEDKCVAMHIISSFIKFYYAKLYKIPIVSYQKIMSLDEDALRSYLRPKMTCIEGLQLNKLTEYIISRRDIEALDAKASYSIRVQKALLHYIEQLEPEVAEMLHED
jgi:hypothetical protein